MAMLNQSTSSALKWLPFVTIIVLSIGLYWMFSQRMVSMDWPQLRSLSIENGFLFVIVVLLMPVNWLLEAMKFRLFLGRKADGNLGNQFKAVLGGVSLSMLLPNRMGEFAGRLLFITSGNRPAGFSATVACSSLQMIWILLFGGLALGWSGGINLLTQKAYLDPVMALVAVVVAISLIFILSSFGKTSRFLKESISHFRISLGFKTVTVGLILALVRYSVFNVQFGLLLVATGCNLSWMSIIQFTTLVYFCQSIIPLPPAVGWIGRLQLAVVVSGLLFVSPAQAVLASLMLWTINLLLPGFAGAYFIAKSTRYNEINLVNSKNYAV